MKRAGRALPARRSGSSRGFTLLEMAVVLAIVGLLFALAISSMSDMIRRTDFASATGDVLTGLRRTQQEATGRGAYTAFVIDTTNGKWWGIQTDSTFDLSTFDETNPGNVIVSGTLPSRTMSFGPAAGFGKALPVPFDKVPVLTTQSPNLAYCSFCDTGTKRGSMLFEPGGNRVKFNSGAPATVGQQLTLNWSFKQSSDQAVIAVIERTGLIEAFRK